MTQQTATQMMTRAQQVSHAEDLHMQGCKGPGQHVIVSADVDGFGNVDIVAIPSIRNGEGGTANVLAEGLLSCMPTNMGAFRHITLSDGDVLVKLPPGQAKRILEAERKRRSECTVFIRLGLE